MARPIRNTPILIGEDARQFVMAASEIPSEESRRVERARIEESVKLLDSMLANLPK